MNNDYVRSLYLLYKILLKFSTTCKREGMRVVLVSLYKLERSNNVLRYIVHSGERSYTCVILFTKWKMRECKSEAYKKIYNFSMDGINGCNT